ncbi:MAG: hypothetical protein BWY74_01176 [Firmicutes bacterium ADurb.Bin419]|nr:MAG: hypothetical protein BWY74_01176 [Firmicutes bacterium ADurb.Bin419]
MRIHFIDTSVLVNILDIPNMNQDRKAVIEEYDALKTDRGNTFILPLATIIETGNHIAHISDGNIRWIKGNEFSQMLMKIASDNFPWKFFESEVTRDEVMIIARKLPESVKYESGAGDISIITAFEKYIDITPGIGYIRIWSTDHHLKHYEKNLVMPVTRKRRK